MISRGRAPRSSTSAPARPACRGRPGPRGTPSTHALSPARSPGRHPRKATYAANHQARRSLTVTLTLTSPWGRRCPHGRVCSTTAACRITAARPLSPRCCIPAREVMLTRHHQGFPVSRPVPSLPLACDPRPERGPLGFSMSSAPGRYRPRTSWRGQVTDTNPKSHHRHQPASISDGLTPHVRPHVAGITHTSCYLNIHRLAPFALRTALPSSLAGRYSCDYYGARVTVGLAPRR